MAGDLVLKAARKRLAVLHVLAAETDLAPNAAASAVDALNLK